MNHKVTRLRELIGIKWYIHKKVKPFLSERMPHVVSEPGAIAMGPSIPLRFDILLAVLTQRCAANPHLAVIASVEAKCL